MNDKLKHFIACSLVSIATLTVTAQIVEPIPFDKKWHMAAGAFAGTWGTFMGNSLDLSAEESALVGVASSVMAGVGKELWDVSEEILFGKEHNFDVMDIAATTFGGVIGVGLSYAALKIFKKPPVIYAEVNKGFEVGFKKMF